MQCIVIMQPLREDIKYYFADFVRKGGTPPPVRTKNLPKKNYGFGGFPPSPLYGHSSENFSSVSAKNNVFCQKKNTCFLVQKKVTDLGSTPLPPFMDKIFSG